MKEKNCIYSKEELSLLDPMKIPHHIAIIMDGNRRWAKMNKKHYLLGHKRGVENLERIVRAAIALKVKILTAYAFSTENWNRSKKEISSILQLFQIYLKRYARIMKKEDVRMRIIGDVSKFSLKIQALLKESEEYTADGKKMELVLAVNYGGRDEIKRALKNIVVDCENKKIDKKDIDENLISSYLDTSFAKDPDLLIRTSGELRLSNFLLWQMSYAEFFVVETFWPDFSEKHLFDAILEYQKRERRFGSL
jgi:undecaprenyl diphosphate synthase